MYNYVYTRYVRAFHGARCVGTCTGVNTVSSVYVRAAVTRFIIYLAKFEIMLCLA